MTPRHRSPRHPERSAKGAQSKDAQSAANVNIAPLPVWHGGMLAAEYDRTSGIIRINSHAIARIREHLGESAAESFVACAIAHERFHRDHPLATEAQAHAHVRATCGEDPQRFEAVLRA
jgi:hypothetical protein